MKVYIAGPYTKGDVAQNVANAIEAGNAIAETGGCPFIPHLSHFWHMLYPHHWQFWMNQDLVWLRECDAVLRLPGQSTGADMETLEAERLGLPVFTSLTECLKWLTEHAN